MLHIVNGDIVAQKLAAGGVDGERLVWREVYSYGPLFPVGEENFAERPGLAKRAAYLEARMGIPAHEFVRAAEEQEERLARLGLYKEVVLWFEHDLFDQAMLCRLLHGIRRTMLGGANIATLSLVGIGEYPGLSPFRGLGQLSPPQLAELLHLRREVTLEQLEAGARWWESYTSPHMQAHLDELRMNGSPLPFARDAFKAHLDRLPAVGNGLGSIQQTTVEELANGPLASSALFRRVGDRLSLLGMGDLEFWRWLEDMTQQPYPLLRQIGSAPFPHYLDSAPAFRAAAFELTEWGERALAGELDWQAVQRPEYWLGGLRVSGGTAWRWDRSSATLAE